MSTEQKVAVVTGAARGIGKACAMDLARAGYNLVLVDLLSKRNWRTRPGRLPPRAERRCRSLQTYPATSAPARSSPRRSSRSAGSIFC